MSRLALLFCRWIQWSFAGALDCVVKWSKNCFCSAGVAKQVWFDERAVHSPHSSPGDKRSLALFLAPFGIEKKWIFSTITWIRPDSLTLNVYHVSRSLHLPLNINPTAHVSQCEQKKCLRHDEAKWNCVYITFLLFAVTSKFCCFCGPKKKKKWVRFINGKHPSPAGAAIVKWSHSNMDTSVIISLKPLWDALATIINFDCGCAKPPWEPFDFISHRRNFFSHRETFRGS